MEFEWDDAKRLANIARHKLDFADAAVVFNGALIVHDAKTVDGERRSIATGRLQGVYVSIVYTMRNGVIRVISMRRARDGERGQHQALHGG